MNAKQARFELSKIYPSVGFQRKLARMDDQQVMAIYFRVMDPNSYRKNSSRNKSRKDS